MKYKEIKAMAPTELQEKEKEMRIMLMKEYMHVATGTVPKSPGIINRTKKILARINTLRTETRKNE